MKKRNFLKNTFITTGSLLIGGAAIHRFLGDKEPVESPLPPLIERVHQGEKKNVLGGNEKGVYCAGGCTGYEKLAREIDSKHLDNTYQLGLKL